MEVKCDNNEMTDDLTSHWERLQELQRKKMKLLKEEAEKIQKEKDTMNSVVAANNISNNDIIEINAGGEIISALRSTLTHAHDSMFSHMFSGRWEESLIRDTNGRVFIDEDSELIVFIVNFLRMKKREDPFHPTAVEACTIPDKKKKSFASLLKYYGLTDFFYPPSIYLPLDIDNIDVVQPHSSLVNVTKNLNKIQFSKIEEKGFHFVACKPPLVSSGEGSFWKVTIDALGDTNTNGWINLGIIGNLDASIYSYSDSTSYGWAGRSQVYQAGIFQAGTARHEDSGWTKFTEGECLYFHLKADKLTMFSVQKDKKFTMNIATTVDAYYIHFNMHHIGDKLMLEPLGHDERARFL